MKRNAAERLLGQQRLNAGRAKHAAASESCPTPRPPVFGPVRRTFGPMHDNLARPNAH